MKRKAYLGLWVVFLHLGPGTGYRFNDLIEIEAGDTKEYKGAWANVLVKGKTIQEALEILPLGLKELCFEIIFIDAVQNVFTLADSNELTNGVLDECDWLLKTKYKYMISDKLFPYI
jgi:hypothetical protein